MATPGSRALALSPASAAFAEVLDLGAELTALLERVVRLRGHVTLAQYRALSHLRSAHPEPIEPWQLARALATGSAHVTAILDSLAALGLVARAPHARDRRRRLVTLTDGGLARIDSLAPEVAALEARLLGDALSDAERVRLTQLARRVRASLATLDLPEPPARLGP